MTSERATMLASLGVDPANVREIARAPAVDAGVSHGYAGSSAPEKLSPHFELVQWPGHTTMPQVARHQLEPSVVRIEVAVSQIAGNASRHGAETYLDARGGKRAMALLETAEGPVVVENGPDGVALFAMPSGEGALSQWDDWTSLPVELSSAPPLPDVSGWLGEHLKALAASTSIVDQTAAAGAIARFHVVRTAIESIASWARALQQREREAVERLAIERGGRLHDELSELEDEVADDVVLRLAMERDILDSAQSVLWLAAAGQRLARELRAVDDIAVTKLSCFGPSASLDENEHLAAVSAIDPDAWWGRLGSD